MFGETTAHRNARIARQTERFPELQLASTSEVFSVDRFLRDQGQQPTGPGQEVEEAYFNNALQRFREVDRATPIPQTLDSPALAPQTMDAFRAGLRQAQSPGMTPSAPGFAPLPMSEIQDITGTPRAGAPASPLSALGVPQVYSASQQAVLGALTGGNPLESVQQAARGFLGQQQFSEQDLGFARLLPEESRVRSALGTALGIAVDPITIGTAGLGGAAAALPRGVRWAVEPFVSGGFGSRYAAEAALGAGVGVTAGQLTEEGIPVPAALAGGLALGVGGIAGARGVGAISRSVDEAAIRAAGGPTERTALGGLREAQPIDVPLGDPLDTMVRTYTPSPGAVDVNHQRLPNGTTTGADAVGTPSVIFDWSRPVRNADDVLRSRSDAARAYATSQTRNEEEVYGGVIDALETARAVVDTDPVGLVRRVASHIPVLREISDWDRPGLSMPKRLLESHIAATGTYASLRSEQGVVRNNLNATIDSVFGEGASLGQPVLYGARKDIDSAHQIIINNAPVEYPASGTVFDFLQRPWAYNATDEMLEVARLWDQADEAFRSNVVSAFGADIPRFEPTRGGVYVRNVNASEYSQRMAEQARRGRPVGLGDVDERVWDNAFVRWADSQNRAARGALKQDEAFVPETNLRLIGDSEDAIKASAARDIVLRAGIDAKTATEVKESLVPGLVARRNDLRRNVENIASRIRNAEQSIRSDAAVARQLDSQYEQTVNRIAALESQAARTAERSRALSVDDAREALRQANETLRQSITELRRAGVEAPTARQAERQVDEIFRRADELQTEADAILKEMVDVFEPGAVSTVRRPLDIVARAQEKADEAIAAALEAEQQILARVTRAQTASQDAEAARMLLREAETGLDAAWRTEDKLNSFETAINELQRRADALYDTLARTTGRADIAADRVEALRTDLASAREAYKSVQNAYNNVELTGWQSVNRMPGRYLRADEAAQANRMLAEANYNPFFDFLENLRGQVLTGDAGPMSFIQGVFLATRQPVGTIRAVAESVAESVRRGDFLLPYRRETMEQYLRDNAQDVAEYAFYVGRMPGGVLPEEVARTGLLGKFIPNFDYANAAMFNVILRRNIDYFKGVRDDLIEAGYTRQQASAAASDILNKSNPLMMTARLGQSESVARAQRLLPTSLAFVRQPWAIQGEAVGALRKLMTPGQNPTPREMLALKIWGRMVGTGIGIGVTSAAINAQQRGDSVVDAVADSLDPNSRSFMAINMGSYSIPIANAFRAPFSLSSGVIRNLVNTAPGVDTGDPRSRDSVINYATARIAPSIQSIMVAYTELTAPPHQRAYQGESELLRGLSAARIGGQAALPIPAQGMIEEVERQRADGEFDPALFIATALAEFGGASLIPEDSMRALDVKARQQYGHAFEDLSWRDQNALLAANPDVADRTLRERREKAQKALEGSGLFEIQDTVWGALRKVNGIEAETRDEFREQWIDERTQLNVKVGVSDPRGAAVQDYNSLDIEREYSAMIQRARLEWALENMSTGLLPIAVRHNFIPSNIATRGILEAVE